MRLEKNAIAFSEVSNLIRDEKNAIVFFDFHDSAVEDFTKKSSPPPGSLNQSDPAGPWQRPVPFPHVYSGSP